MIVLLPEGASCDLLPAQQAAKTPAKTPAPRNTAGEL